MTTAPTPGLGLASARSATRLWAGAATTSWPALGAVAGAFAAMGWVAALLLRRIDGLSAPPYDLAFFQQVVWNIGNGGQWVSSFHHGSFLGLHFSPLLVVPALVERFIWADVRVLSLIQAAAVGALVPATFLFLRAALAPSRAAGSVALALSIGIPVWGASQDVIRSDFHPETVGVVLALLAGWAGLSNRPRLMWAMAIVALTTREDLAYAVGVIGLAVAVRGRAGARQHGRALAVVAAAWAVVVFGVLMPVFRDGLPSDTDRYYAWLGGGLGALGAPFTMPDRVLAALARPAPWFVVAGLIVSLVGLPLLRPRWALLVIPPLVALLLSGHWLQAELRLQYPLILVVPLTVAAGAGARRAIAIAGHLRFPGARHRPGPRRLTTTASLGLFVVMTAPAVAGAWVQGSLPPFDSSDPAFAERPGSIDRVRRVAASVPSGELLLADDGLMAPLAGRSAIGRLTAFAVPRADAYLLVDRDAWEPTAAARVRHDQIITGSQSSTRPVIADDGRFVVWGPQARGDLP